MKTRQYIQPRFLGSKKKKIEIEYFSSGQINYFKFLRFFVVFRIKHLSKFKAKKVRFSS